MNDHTFKTFPEFTRLKPSDKDRYKLLIKDFPPMYDISFPGLVTWWNSLGNMTISQLNGNLIIPYWIPGAADNGLSIVGTKNIDETICTIFDFLREKGEEVRIVNVPEFVLSNVRYHDMFVFKEQRGYFEYIMPLEHFYPIKNMTPHWRQKVERLLKLPEGDIVVKGVDLNVTSERNMLLEAAKKWRTKNKINDYGEIEGECMEMFIKKAEQLEIENICLFVSGKLLGFCLYEVPVDKNYVIMKHIKATDKTAFGFEYLAYFFSKWLIERGFKYVNLGPDYSLQSLRMFMLTVASNDFFRKYTIEPKD